jgi:hypothetical protein
MTNWTEQDIAFGMSDAKRRQRQSERIVRILRVHKLTRARDVNEAKKRKIAETIGVNIRTVHRDIATLRLLYKTLGTTKLD